MEKTRNKTNIARGRAVGLLCLIVFLLAFIFACMKNILPFGKLIFGTFGFMVYPTSLILAFVSLAKFLGMHYRNSKKATAFVVLALVSVLLVVQSIMTFGRLNSVATFSTMKDYLKFSYNGNGTLMGGFGSVFLGLFAILLGAMGDIVVFVILATVFIGLFVDYEFYGKYEAPHIKKLKSRKLREKISNCDKNIKEGETPNYSFADGEVAHEIVAPAENYETNYADSQNEAFSTIEADENFENTDEDHASNFFSSSENDSRRDFINATFGGKGDERANSSEFNSQNDSGFSFESEDNSSENQFADEFSKILNSSEDLDENITPSENDFDFSVQKSENDVFGLKNEPTFEPHENRPVYEPPKREMFNPRPQMHETFGQGFAQFDQKPEPPKPAFVVPKKEINVSSGINLGVPGIRYNPPPTNLLNYAQPDKGNHLEEQSRKSRLLEQVLDSFKIKGVVKNIVRGPKITRYELSLPAGVSVNKIPPMENDIAAALSAKTITIKAPVLGTNFVGVELENDSFSNVSERELFECEAFKNSSNPIPIAIGKDISGEIVVKSLAKMVHVLVAGSTGSGKSVFLHNVILSIIFKNSPDDARLMIIDPKEGCEFGRYEGLPHLVTPHVVNGRKNALSALKWCVKEMYRRYELLKKAKVNKIELFNKSDLVKSGMEQKMPYLVVIVDELAEIMLVDKKAADEALQRLTQLARACGIHLVLAVQRPSVDVITGVIKNNVPSRIAFRLQSAVDSRTILNTMGAEKLLGQGDMLMALSDTAAIPRLQAGYANDDEIQKVIDYTIKNNSCNFDEEAYTMIMNNDVEIDDPDKPAEESNASGVAMPSQRSKPDEYFMAAVAAVMRNNGASTSFIQRSFGTGYARSARIIDQMEKCGYISAGNGSKPRSVLITPEQFRNDFGVDFNSIGF